MQKDEEAAKTFDHLSKTLSCLYADPDTLDNAEAELAYLSSYKQDRYRKIEKMLK